MIVALVLLCVLVAAGAAGVTAARHRRQVTAWERELDAAFGPQQLHELPRHRSL
jgi:hypothetical protein